MRLRIHSPLYALFPNHKLPTCPGYEYKYREMYWYIWTTQCFKITLYLVAFCPLNLSLDQPATSRSTLINLTKGFNFHGAKSQWLRAGHRCLELPPRCLRTEIDTAHAAKYIKRPLRFQVIMLECSYKRGFPSAKQYLLLNGLAWCDAPPPPSTGATLIV